MQTTTITTEQAEKLGNPWTHPRTGKTRYYINDTTIWGLSYETYKTGNISRATLNGEKISNRWAGWLANLQVWIEDGQVIVKHRYDDTVDDDTVEMIRERVVEAAQRVAEEES